MSEEDLKENTEENKASEAPKKKSKWLKVLLVLFGLFCALIVGIYLYISSASFVRGQVFSRVESKLNQPVTAEEINFSPLSGLELTNFSLGDDPFLKAEKIKVAYELLPMLSNEINVSEVTLENAELNVIYDRDGNLTLKSKMVKKIKDKDEKKKDDKKDKDPSTKKDKNKGDTPQLNITGINFKNLKIHLFKDNSKEERQVTLNLDNFSFSIPKIKNGEDLKFELETAINIKAGEKFNLKQGQIKVSGKTSLSESLEPSLIGLDIKIADLDAHNEGVKLPLKALNLLLDAGIDGEKITINDFKIENPERQSFVSVQGLLEKENIDIDLGINNVDSTILDLALVPLSGSKPFIRWQEALAQVSEGKIAGFGSTVINFTGTVKGNPKKAVDAQGELQINKLPLVQISSNSSVVPISTKLIYDLNANNGTKTLELKKLSVSVKDEEKQIAGINLRSPLKFDMENSKLSSGLDNKLALNLNAFDLNLIKAFRKAKDRGVYDKGFISADIELLSHNSEEELMLDIKNFSLKDFAFRKNEDEVIANINADTTGKLSVNDLAKINLQDLTFSLKQLNNELASFQGSGLINLDNVEANINLSSLNIRPHVKPFIPNKVIEDFGLDNVNLSSNQLKVHYSKGGINSEGQLLVREMSLGGKKLPAKASISKATNFKVSLDETKTLTIENFDINLTSDGKRALSATLSGRQNSKMQLVSIQFSDLRLHPVLSKFIPEKVKRKFGLGNLNLDSKDLKLDLVKDNLAVKGALFSNGIALGGEQFNESFKLSHSTSFDIKLVKDQLVDIKNLNVSLQTDSKEALNLAAIGSYRPGDKAVKLKVSQLDINPGMRNLLPPELVQKFGLNNLNGKSNGIEIDYTEGQAGFIKADFAMNKLGIGGTAYRPFNLSQALNVDVSIDKNGILKIGQFHSKTNPSFTNEVEVIAKGKVDLNFQRSDSEISVDVPSIVDLDTLMKLAKKQQKKKAVNNTSKEEKTADNGTAQPTVPAKAKEKPPIKMTVKTSINEVLFDGQSIKGIRATAFIDGQNYTLKEGVMQVGDAILKAAGRMTNGPTKSLSVNVSSSGPIDLGPINDIVNAGTDKKLSGKVTVQQLSATTSGKNNEELTNNLEAAGKLFLQEFKMLNYAKVPGGKLILDTIIGVNPGNMSFDQGLVDLKMKNGILTINQCDLQGSSLGFNPRGTIDLKNQTFDIKMQTTFGFAGGSVLQMITGNPGLMQLINNQTKELRSFQEDFPYDPSKRKFVMKEDFLFNKVIKTDNKGRAKNLTENLTGLNALGSDFLVAMFMEVAARANMKEAAGIAATLSGKGNLKDNILNIGKGLLERELNKDRENMDDKKDDPLGTILDIFGGNKKKKKDQEKKQQQQPKKEEKKKEDPINKEDDLIKQIENIIK